jgi:hypothetical protein
VGRVGGGAEGGVGGGVGGVGGGTSLWRSILSRKRSKIEVMCQKGGL